MLKRPDHAFGFGLKDPMPYGRIDEWVFLMMDDMSPDYETGMKSQRKTDIMEVCNNDLGKSYRATGAVTECGPYERNYAQVGNEWPEPTGSQLKMDHGQGWIAARYGSRWDMDG